MHKRIDGKRYDTETAKRLAYWDNDKAYNDLFYYAETLYVKRTGEYFLHLEGGPRTNLARWLSDETVIGGDEIVPITETGARVWLAIKKADSAIIEHNDVMKLEVAQ